MENSSENFRPLSTPVRKIIQIGFAIAAIALLFFVIRIAIFALHWSNPEHRGLPLEDWMTIGYMAKTYHIPREELARALEQRFDIDLEPGQRKTIRQIARLTDETPLEIRREIAEILDDIQGDD